MRRSRERQVHWGMDMLGCRRMGRMGREVRMLEEPLTQPTLTPIHTHPILTHPPTTPHKHLSATIRTRPCTICLQITRTFMLLEEVLLEGQEPRILIKCEPSWRSET